MNLPIKIATVGLIVFTYLFAFADTDANGSKNSKIEAAGKILFPDNVRYARNVGYLGESIQTLLTILPENSHEERASLGRIKILLNRIADNKIASEQSPAVLDLMRVLIPRLHENALSQDADKKRQFKNDLKKIDYLSVLTDTSKISTLLTGDHLKMSVYLNTEPELSGDPAIKYFYPASEILALSGPAKDKALSRYKDDQKALVAQQKEYERIDVENKRLDENIMAHDKKRREAGKASIKAFLDASARAQHNAASAANK